MQTFRDHRDRQIDPIKRRFIEGETIPHDEKVFSLFQPHTEWISKSKAGGRWIGYMCLYYGFMSHHKVLQKETNDKIAIEMVKTTQEKFPKFNACSFDKSFYSKGNQTGHGTTMINQTKKQVA